MTELEWVGRGFTDFFSTAKGTEKGDVDALGQFKISGGKKVISKAKNTWAAEDVFNSHFVTGNQI